MNDPLHMLETLCDAFLYQRHIINNKHDRYLCLLGQNCIHALLQVSKLKAGRQLFKKFVMVLAISCEFRVLVWIMAELSKSANDDDTTKTALYNDFKNFVTSWFRVSYIFKRNGTDFKKLDGS